MEPNLFIIMAFVTTIIKTTLQGGDQERTFNGTSLDNFQEVVNTLVAENKKSETKTYEVNATNVHVEERSGDKLITNEEEIINSMKENANNESNSHADIQNSHITYLNDLLKSLPRDKNFDELNSSDIEQFLNSRKANGESILGTSKPVLKITTVPHEETSDLVSKEEITVEIDDHSRGGQPVTAKRTVLNSTVAITKNSNNNDGMKPETTTPSFFKEKATVISARAHEVPKTPFDASLPYSEDATNLKLLTELNKLNAKMDEVEDLLKGNIIRDKAEITSGRRSMGTQGGGIQVPGLNLPHPTDQVNPPYSRANEYKRVNVPNVVTKTPALRSGLTEAARNQMLLFQLGRMAQKRHDIALVDSLPRPSGVILHLPAVYRRRLIVTR